MEEELSLENILDSEEIDNLFTEDDEEIQDTPPEEKKEKEKEKQDTTEVNVDDLFDAEPESVGSEDIEDKGDTNSSKGNKTSPKNNFYSSIAKALKDEGIFPDLDDETVNNVTAPEDFVDVIEKHIQSQLDDRQKRIDEALNAGVEPSEISSYERTINYLNSIDTNAIEDESEKGETLRKQLIYQDFVNRGYSKERAQREVQKSFNSGSDIEDAKEALASNKDYFTESYNNLIKEAKNEVKRVEKERKDQAEKLKKSILEDNKVFGDIQIDKVNRKKIFDNISKPVYKDPESGEFLTAIQKYESENKLDFLKYVGLFYTLTDGFKNVDGLIKGKVKREVNKSLRELESKINNTNRSTDGNLRFVGNINEDSDSYIGKGWDLDL